MVLCCDRGCSSGLPPASHRACRISRPVCQMSSKSLWQLVMPQRGPCMVTHSDLQMPSATQSLSYASAQKTQTQKHSSGLTAHHVQSSILIYPPFNPAQLDNAGGTECPPRSCCMCPYVTYALCELWLRRVGGWHEDAGSLFCNSSLHARTELTWVAYFTKNHYSRN